MTKIVNGYAAKLNCPTHKKCFALKYFNLGIFTILSVLGVLYMINISKLTEQGFALRDLKFNLSTLASENMESEELVNAAQSYYSLSLRTKDLNMVAIANVEYLSPSGQAVAKK